MSAVVARRLQEIAEQGETRRRRISEIRQQSSLLVDEVQRLRSEHDRPVVWSTPAAVMRRLPVDSHNRNDTPDQVAVPIDGDVLSQVQQILHEIDTQEREHWNEDDTFILICLQSALAAAMRKGYALQEVRAILDGLKPPDMNT